MVRFFSDINKVLLVGSFSIFLLITGYPLFSEGMFVDGLVYATVAKNLSSGLGDFWHLYYTETVYKEFHEHPPLGIGLQAIFYHFFGDHLWVERMYSLLCFSVLSGLMIKCWKVITGSFKLVWLPILFVSVIPLVSWSTANNMLENTMSVFTFLTGLLILLHRKKQQSWLLLFAGVALSLAFLTKGFTGLFVLGLPFCFILFDKEYSSSVFVKETLLLICGTALPLLVLFLFFPESFDAIRAYFWRQVVGSVENLSTVDSRFYIVFKLFTELLIPIGFVILLLVWNKKMKKKGLKRNFFSLGGSLILLGFCGVFPIMVSMKQSGFYILCTFPFFAIGLSLLVHDVGLHFQDQVLSLYTKSIKFFVAVLFIAAVVCSSVGSVSVGKNEEKLAVVKKVLSYTGNDCFLSVGQSMSEDWGLIGYFARYGNVSLISSLKRKENYLLFSEVVDNDRYQLVFSTNNFFFYKFIK